MIKGGQHQKKINHCLIGHSNMLKIWHPNAIMNGEALFIAPDKLVVHTKSEHASRKKFFMCESIDVKFQFIMHWIECSELMVRDERELSWKFVGRIRNIWCNCLGCFYWSFQRIELGESKWRVWRWKLKDFEAFEGETWRKVLQNEVRGCLWWFSDNFGFLCQQDVQELNLCSAHLFDAWSCVLCCYAFNSILRKWNWTFCDLWWSLWN